MFELTRHAFPEERIALDNKKRKQLVTSGGATTFDLEMLEDLDDEGKKSLQALSKHIIS